MCSQKNRVLTKHDKKPASVLRQRLPEAIHDLGIEPSARRGPNCASAIDRWVNEGGAISPRTQAIRRSEHSKYESC